MNTTPIANAIRNRTTLVGVAPQAPAPHNEQAVWDRRIRIYRWAISLDNRLEAGDMLTIRETNQWVWRALTELEGR